MYERLSRSAILNAAPPPPSPPPFSLQVNAWFVESRNPETGEYPEFPAPEDGGSKARHEGGQGGEGGGV